MQATIQPASESMRKSAEDFYDLLYVKHDFVGAMKGHVSPDFIEHNPDLPNSPDQQIQWFADRAAANPDKFAAETEWNTRLVHKFITGDYLIVHYFMSVSTKDKGRMFADFWRYEGDKIVEHWDVLQAVPETTRSGNPMW